MFNYSRNEFSIVYNMKCTSSGYNIFSTYLFK